MKVYIVFYSRRHPYDDIDYITGRISKIFKTEEKAIKYLESFDKKPRNIIGISIMEFVIE